ncbi:hypothetical protein QUF56_10905 [Ureibacillus composti]|nr:hypothetical protein [Ureibacillus composti]
MKWLVYLIFIILYIMVTFFGLGPVLMADGSSQERFITFVVVVIIYIVITFFLVLWRRKVNKKK